VPGLRWSDRAGAVTACVAPRLARGGRHAVPGRGRRSRR
jgi:hypothetical protein